LGVFENVNSPRIFDHKAFKIASDELRGRYVTASVTDNLAAQYLKTFAPGKRAPLLAVYQYSSVTSSSKVYFYELAIGTSSTQMIKLIESASRMKVVDLTINNFPSFYMDTLNKKRPALLLISETASTLTQASLNFEKLNERANVAILLRSDQKALTNELMSLYDLQNGQLPSAVHLCPKTGRARVLTNLNANRLDQWLESGARDQDSIRTPRFGSNVFKNTELLVDYTNLVYGSGSHTMRVNATVHHMPTMQTCEARGDCAQVRSFQDAETKLKKMVVVHQHWNSDE